MSASLRVAHLFIAAPIFAVPICPPTKDQLGVYHDVNGMILKAAQFGAADRQTAAEFGKKTNESAEVINQRYAASGHLRCTGYGWNSDSQAQVVLRGDILLTTAHGLHNGEDCAKPYDVKACKFTIEKQGKKISYDVDSKVSTGYVCPNKTKNKDNADWAILKLKKSVDPSVKPYEIVNPPCVNQSGPADVVYVGKSADFHTKEGEGTFSAPRHFGRCKVLDNACIDSAEPMKTDCDAEHGGSGGGMFADEQNPKIFGIMVFIQEDCPTDKKAKVGEYNRRCYNSQAIPIATELRKKIEEAAKVNVGPSQGPKLDFKIDMKGGFGR